MNQPVRMLALGDSYTIGESVNVSERWPNQFRDSLLVRGISVDTVGIIATTGWTTANLLNAISGQQLEEDNYNLVSLLIGVNNQYQNKPLSTYYNEFPKLLDSCIAYANGDTSSVFVVSIPDYAYTPFGGGNPQISNEIDLYNHINDSITAAYGIQYFNITPISRQGLNDPSLVATDGLHPSGYQYSLWVELMMGYVDSVGVGVSDFEVGAIRIYPNPATEEIHIDLTNSKLIDALEIYSLTGQLVDTASLTPSSVQRISTENLQSGTYLLKFKRKGSIVATRKVVVD